MENPDAEPREIKNATVAERRSQRRALAAGALAMFIMGLCFGVRWTRALIQTLVIALVIVVSMRVTFGKGTWSSRW